MEDLAEVRNALEEMVDQNDAPVATAPQIADRIDMDRRRVHERLKMLEVADAAGSMEVGARARVWWPADEDESTDERPTAPAAERARSTTPPSDGARERASDSPDADADALDGWEPGRTQQDRSDRLAVGRELLAWLGEHGPAQRADVLEAREDVDGDRDDVTDDAWWRRLARPALKQAAENGYVDVENGRVYEWTG